jgi:hypothetical protein
MGFAGNVARMGEMRNVFTSLVRIPERKETLKVQEVDRKMILQDWKGVLSGVHCNHKGVLDIT